MDGNALVVAAADDNRHSPHCNISYRAKGQSLVIDYSPFETVDVAVEDMLRTAHHADETNDAYDVTAEVDVTDDYPISSSYYNNYRHFPRNCTAECN